MDTFKLYENASFTFVYLHYQILGYIMTNAFWNRHRLLQNICKDHCGIIIVRGGFRFVDFMGFPYTHEFTSPRTFNKVMNCFAL